MGLPERVLRILSINKSEKESREILKHLECLGFPISAEHVGSFEEFSQAIQNFWTVVIFSSETSFISSHEALKLIKYPFIVLSSGLGEEKVADLMKAGAEDVVMNSHFDRLSQVVNRVIRESEIREKELKASQMAHEAIASREQMLAIVSHDIRNPLSAIHLEAQMLVKVADRHSDTKLADSVKTQAGRILKTTERLKDLIIDLLDKNKTEENLSALIKTDGDAVKVFQDVLDISRPLLYQKDITIKSNLNAAHLSFDQNKMYQVMNNLLCNAIKFSPVGGTVEIGMDESEHEILFSVSDQGPGLKASDLNRVFDKYWTAGVIGRSGTGLGLYISKTIVEAHGGHIGVENLRGSGARFWFTLPKLFASSNWKKEAKQKILVIDDDEDLREVISWALVQEGFEVEAYADPQFALESLKAGKHFPKLMVVDFRMGSMNGTEFLNEKTKIHTQGVGDCPVVMISAAPEEIDQENHQHLYKMLMAKPLDLNRLIENVLSLVSN